MTGDKQKQRKCGSFAWNLIFAVEKNMFPSVEI